MKGWRNRRLRKCYGKLHVPESAIFDVRSLPSRMPGVKLRELPSCSSQTGHAHTHTHDLGVNDLSGYGDDVLVACAPNAWNFVTEGDTLL